MGRSTCCVANGGGEPWVLSLVTRYQAPEAHFCHFQRIEPPGPQYRLRHGPPALTQGYTVTLRRVPAPPETFPGILEMGKQTQRCSHSPGLPHRTLITLQSQLLAPNTYLVTSGAEVGRTVFLKASIQFLRMPEVMADKV